MSSTRKLGTDDDHPLLVMRVSRRNGGFWARLFLGFRGDGGLIIRPRRQRGRRGGLCRAGGYCGRIERSPDRAGSFSWEMPRCGRSQERSNDQNPSGRRDTTSSEDGSPHRVTGSGRPPPVPTERGVRFSRTTLFDRWFTALRGPAAFRKEVAVLDAATDISP